MTIAPKLPDPPSPLPLQVPIYDDEPALSILRRAAAANGLRLRHLCQGLGRVRGAPDTWSAVALSPAATDRLCVLLRLPTAALTVSTIDPESVPEADVVGWRRRPNWLALDGDCDACLAERDGAALGIWHEPWHIICTDHMTLRGGGDMSDLSAVPHLCQAQDQMTDLAARHTAQALEDAVALARQVIGHWHHSEGLDVRLDDRALMIRPDWRDRPCRPRPPDALLLPEIVAFADAVLSRHHDSGGAIVVDDDLQAVGKRIVGRAVSHHGWRPIRWNCTQLTG